MNASPPPPLSLQRATATERSPGVDVLPDVLAPGLRIVFCGSAAGTASARRGAYYAGPGNRFWRTLQEVGLTDRILQPEAFRDLLRHGLGLTDVAKAAFGADAEIRQRDFLPQAVREKIQRFAPAWLATNGKRAAKELLGRRVGYGVQPERIGRTRVFVLPSTSGAARRYFDLALWQMLANLARGAELSGGR